MEISQKKMRQELNPVTSEAIWGLFHPQNQSIVFYFLVLSASNSGLPNSFIL